MDQKKETPFVCTTIGKKYLMGISGLVWMGFVAGHMAGNLLLFVGPDAYNSYGHAITSGYFIYFVEAVLITCLLSHIILGVQLTLANKKARGSQNYAMQPNGEKGGSFASKTMAIHGSIILIFIISHIRGFKFGTYYETTVNGVVMRDLHRLIVESFQQPGFVVWYVVSLVLLGFHLSHGAQSVFQSFGVRNDRMACLIKKFGIGYAILVAGGFLAQPLYIFLSSR